MTAEEFLNTKNIPRLLDLSEESIQRNITGISILEKYMEEYAQLKVKDVKNQVCEMISKSNLQLPDVVIIRHKIMNIPFEKRVEEN